MTSGIYFPGYVSVGSDFQDGDVNVSGGTAYDLSTGRARVRDYLKVEETFSGKTVVAEGITTDTVTILSGLTSLAETANFAGVAAQSITVGGFDVLTSNTETWKYIDTES